MSRETPSPLEPDRPSEAALLESAAQRLAVRLHEAFPDRSPEEYDQLRRRLARLVVDLHSAATGRARQAMPSEALDGPLLAHLRHELLWLPRSPEEALAALRALRACFRPPEAGAARTPASEGEDLRARMGEPDAFELLVEVAHDFRSPLTSILFLAETLRDGHSGEVNDLQRSQLGLMYSAALGLASMASDVVDLARRHMDVVDEEPTPYAFAEVFRSVERMISPMAEEKGLELRIDFPDRGRSEGHPHALGRVLLNLATNALKFTDQGHVELGVKLYRQGQVEYYVQDTGRGIPVEHQEQLFQPFKTRRGGHDQGHFFSGSGVGLSIARRLVEAMGATLQFESSDDAGTRFWFVLRPPQRR